MTRILVTGGSGFIGTNLVERFIARGDEVLNLDIAAPRHAAHGAAWRRVDLLDGIALAGAVAEFSPEVVLHMAARTDLKGTSLADYRANADGVSNLITALRPLPSLRLAVFASSMLVCRIGYRPLAEDDYQPSTAYGSSKVEGERRVRREAGDAFPWIMLRPTSIWGPWFGSPYRDFFTAVAHGRYVHPRGRRIWRNYGFVLNTVHQVERLVETGGGDALGRTAYLADYEPIELKDWASRIQSELGAPRVREVPVVVLRQVARLGDLLKRLGIDGFPLNSFRLGNLLTDCLLDTAPIERVVGPLPYDLATAVRLTCQWMQSRSGP
jgi:nucleoside-diphosphate-sugar epimerase